MIIILFLFVNLQLDAKNFIMDDFKSNVYVEGKLVAPSGWSKGNEKNSKIDYYIFKEGTDQFLRAEYIASTTAKIVYISKRTNLAETPFLSWKWRARKFPAVKIIGSHNEEVDNVATVYAMFRKNLRSYLIKYQWSQVNCKNNDKSEPLFFQSKSSSRVVIRPLRCTNATKPCCSDKPDVWVTEKVNLAEDYIKFFEKDKDSLPENIEGVGVLSDGDDTNTPGVSADFSNFVLSSD